MAHLSWPVFMQLLTSYKHSLFRKGTKSWEQSCGQCSLVSVVLNAERDQLEGSIWSLFCETAPCIQWLSQSWFPLLLLVAGWVCLKTGISKMGGCPLVFLVKQLISRVGTTSQVVGHNSPPKRCPPPGPQFKFLPIWVSFF